MMPFGFVLTVGVWGAVAWGAYHLTSGRRRARPMRAEDELARRFARGDIDAAEYHERLETLRTTTDRAATSEGTAQRS